MIVFSDMDGTLLTSDKQMSDAADAITEFDNDHDGVARTIMAALA